MSRLQWATFKRKDLLMAAEVQIYAGAVDKGLEGVVACTTAISSIVGATLCYRGYTIEDLAAHSTFEETAFCCGKIVCRRRMS